jgi:hypothetical protein
MLEQAAVVHSVVPNLSVGPVLHVAHALQNGALRPQIVILVQAPPARPGHIAEREELDQALRIGSRSALELFLDRHPDSRYRPEAEKALQRHDLLSPKR